MLKELLPKRDEKHEIGDNAVRIFKDAILSSGLFICRDEAPDYGTDVQLEAKDGDRMTNFRIHCQVKGVTTDRPSVSVATSNLCYLDNQRNSLYVICCVNSKKIFVREAQDVIREYEVRDPSWRKQKTITIRCSQELDACFLERLHKKMLADGINDRENRRESNSLPPHEFLQKIIRKPKDIEVPTDPSAASRLLKELLNEGKDAEISANASKFEAICNSEEDLFRINASEVNLGLNGYQNLNDGRIKRFIEQNQAALNELMICESENVKKTMWKQSVLICNYNIGNGFLALKEYDEAKSYYQQVLILFVQDEIVEEMRSFAAMSSENLASIYEQQGEVSLAIAHYERALELLPSLPESLYSMGRLSIEYGDYQKGLDFLNRICWIGNFSDEKDLSISYFKAYAYFGLEKQKEAFGELNRLISQSSKVDWVLPSCARLVHQFSKGASKEFIRNALNFWSLILKKRNTVDVREKILLCQWKLHFEGDFTGICFKDFKNKALSLIKENHPDPAYLWDKIGHWAQKDGDWLQAEAAYRKAFELDSENYRYCLGTALVFLERYGEAISILSPEIEKNPDDTMTWFQLAIAQEGIGDIDASVVSYEKIIDLDPEYALAYFNLGGTYWNFGDLTCAVYIWMFARAKFPDHECSKKLAQDFPNIFT
jgi:tetratricopeptide (TPR) repeat protein